VVTFSPLFAKQAQKRKRPTVKSWRTDETCIKGKGKWVYFYRAIDKHGKTPDFMLSEHWDEAAATAFSGRMIRHIGFLGSVVIAKKRRQSCRAAEHELLADFARLVLADRYSKG
jgi:putative transposase